MDIISIRDRKSVVQLLKSFSGDFSMAPPFSQCDFFLNIREGLGSSPTTSTFFSREVFARSMPSKNMVIIGFGYPDVGINFTQNNNFFGMAVPGFSVSHIPMEFLWVGLDKSKIHELYEAQFSDKGLIDVKHFKELPDVEIIAVYDHTKMYNMLLMEKCLFTMPQPSVSYKSTEFSTFKVNIHYRDIRYGL